MPMFGRHKKESQLDSDYQETFGTDAGKRVLDHLYREIGYEFSSTLPSDGNRDVGSFNEGRRSTWVLIARRLRKSNEDLRRAFDESEQRRMREIENE